MSRGPGTAPLTLEEQESQLGTNNREAVTNPDLSRATPADLIGLGQDKHEVDKTPTGPRAAGAINNEGQGGEQVWKESLLPSEKEALKKFFK